MKLRTLKLKTFEGATVEALETQVNTWLENASEDTPTRAQSDLVQVDYQVDGGVFYCYILYAES